MAKISKSNVLRKTTKNIDKQRVVETMKVILQGLTEKLWLRGGVREKKKNFINEQK